MSVDPNSVSFEISMGHLGPGQNFPEKKIIDLRRPSTLPNFGRMVDPIETKHYEEMLVFSPISLWSNQNFGQNIYAWKRFSFPLVSDRSVGHNERHPVFCPNMLNCSVLSFGNWSVLCCYVPFDRSLPSPPTGTAVVFLSSCVVSMRDWWCVRQERCCRRLDGPVMRSHLSDALSTLSPVRNRTQVNQGNLVHRYRNTRESTRR